MTEPIAADVAALDAAVADLDRRERELRVALETLGTQRRNLQAQRAALLARLAEQAAAHAAPAADRDLIPAAEPAPAAYALDLAPPPTSAPPPDHPGGAAVGQQPVATQRATAPPSPWGRPTTPPPSLPHPAGPHQVAPPAAPSPAATGERIRETSTRSVQNTLLALGGLLLGVAAIAFTAVAWAKFGDGGRAAIIVVTSGVALTVPIVLAWRGLTATAETIASVGLLLVLLDGYAAWSVGLFGVDEALPAAAYAAAVFAATTVAAASYQAATHLTAPRFAALAAAQPVAPLVAIAAGAHTAGWGFALAGSAAASVALALTTRPAGPGERVDPPAAVARLLGLVLSTVALAGSAVLAVGGLLAADTPSAALRAGGTLLAAAAIGIVVAWASGSRAAELIAGAAAPLALIAVLSRTAALTAPGFGLVGTALAVGLVGLVAATLPARLRDAAAIGCWVAAGALTAVAGAAVVVGAYSTVAAGVPLWRADLTGWADLVASAQPWGWQPTVVTVLLTTAAAVLLPRPFRLPAATAGAGLAIIAVPAGLADVLARAGTGLPWWIPPLIGTASALVLALSSLTGRDARSVVARTATATFLAIYAAATSVPDAFTSAVVVGALLLGCTTIATASTRTKRSALHRRDRYVRRTGAGAAGAGYTMLPAFSAAVAVAAGASGIAALRIALAVGALTLLAATLAPHGRRLRPGRPLPALTVGANLGAVTAAVVGLASIDLDVVSGASAGVVLFAGMYVVISHATTIGEGDEAISQGARAREVHQSAAVATLAAVSALSAVGSWLVPNIGHLVWPAVGVCAASLACVAMPPSWRRGPATGMAIAGGLVVLVAGPMANYHAGLTVRASLPVWRAPGDPTSALPVDDIFGWRLPAALVLLALAATVLPRVAATRAAPTDQARLQWAAASTCGGLAALAAPVALGLPRWTAPAIAATAAFAFGVLAVLSRRTTASYPGAVVAAILTGYAVATSLSQPAMTGMTFAAITLMAACVAVLGRMAGAAAGAPAHRIGGVAVAIGLAAGVGAAASVAAAVPLPGAAVVQVMMGAASLTLVVAAVLRSARSGYLPYAVAGVAVAAVASWLAVLPTSEPSGVYAAVAGLIGVGAGLLLLPRLRDATVGVCVAAGVPLLGAAVSVVPAVVALVQPVQWIGAVWSVTPTGTRDGLAPGWEWHGDGWDATTLLLLTVAAGLITLGLRGARWVPAAVLPGCAAALLVAPVALDSPWPALPVLALMLAAATGIGAAVLSGPRGGGTDPLRWVAREAAVICVTAGSVGLANSLATAPMTIAALSVIVLAGAAGAILGRSAAARSVGWATVGVAGAALVFACGRTAGLPDSRTAFGVLAVAVVMLAAAAVLPAHRTPERRATDVVSYLTLTFAVGLALTSPTLTPTALVLACYGVALGLSALPPARRRATTRLVVTAATCELVASWLLLAAADVGVIEAYTVPLALLAMLGGALELRRRPALRSWLAYGPALLAAFAPSLMLVFTGAGDGSPPRRLALGVGALMVVITGAVRRRQAPVVAGAVVLVAVALHELVVLFELLPTWLPLAIGGALLVILGATYEKRRRDLVRLRAALTRMR